MTLRELQAFLRDEQKDPLVDDASHVNSLFRDFAQAPNRFRDPKQPSLPSLTLSEVCSFSYLPCTTSNGLYYVSCLIPICIPQQCRAISTCTNVHLYAWWSHMGWLGEIGFSLGRNPTWVLDDTHQHLIQLGA